MPTRSDNCIDPAVERAREARDTLARELARSRELVTERRDMLAERNRIRYEFD
jgi:hypothetical protein